MFFVEIGSKEYYLRMFFEIFFFYVIFFSLYDWKFNKKKLFLIVILFPLSFIAQTYLEGSAEVLSFIFCYFILKDATFEKYLLLNALALSANIPYLISMTVSSFIMNMVSLHGLSDVEYISVELFCEVCILLSIISLFYITHFRKLIIKYSSKFSFSLLAVNYFFLQFYLYAADYFNVYEQFILGTTGLLFLQCFILFHIFVREVKRQKRMYEDKIFKEQLDHIKVYAEYLEKNQEKIREFRHDYKNLLLSLREAASNHQVDLLIEQIDVLSNYSKNYCNSLEFHQTDIKNLKNSYLKSFLISKINLINQKGILYHFECLDTIENVDIDIFDLIRILGVSVDNAIEEVIELDQANINITILHNEEQTEFIIENTTKVENLDISKISRHGYSSKMGHSGIGLSSIQEIKKRYPNMFIQYKSKKNQFIVQIIIINEEEN